MHTPVPSPWLPGYIHVAQSVLIILTMAGLFPDRLHMCYYFKKGKNATEMQKQICTVYGDIAVTD